MLRAGRGLPHAREKRPRTDAGTQSSGAIYSWLRGVPNYGVDARGNPTYIAGDRHQYLWEAYIVGLLLVLGSLFLVASASDMRPVRRLFGGTSERVHLVIPALRTVCLLTAVVLIRTFFALYLKKAHWYAQGLGSTWLTFPWIV